ncbi:EAL domain-containing protein [Paenibacillus lutrae]|uniref:EAL domain-containing protein n=1 Tax=Paenibacillus lutrae TaxID=2078573 RepID=A0A7X3K1D3_9BACL|nr:EAL domain-containing protein [Paenibacillus lutrae]MVP02123.1 EAL domain-containing protein [Paenibacillus lutrae]
MLSDCYVVYQPIRHLKTGGLYGYEALLRGNKSPSEIIADAVKNNIVADMDHSIHDLALKSLPHLEKEKKIFLNVHPHSVPDLAIVDRSKYLHIEGDIVFEITEQSEFQFDLSRSIEGWRRSGINIALDDFGNGYNRINLLDVVSPNFIKIDKTLIQSLRSPIIRDFVHFTVIWGRQYGAEIIAEGIETANQLEQCREIGITIGQGYFLGMPDQIYTTRGVAK